MNYRTHSDIITTLQHHIHTKLAPLMPENGTLALLDYPDHPNVGDSAIWLGEITYLKQWQRITPILSALSKNSRTKIYGPLFRTGLFFCMAVAILATSGPSINIFVK